MKDSSPAQLYDVIQSAHWILEFVADINFEQYSTSELLRSAVERKFEIMGEALNRIKKTDPDVLNAINNHRDIISFRNILAHGYDTIDDRIVWSVINDDLRQVIDDAEGLLES